MSDISKKTKISVYLIKENVSPKDIVDENSRLIDVDGMPEEYILRARRHDNSRPDWVSSFFSSSIEDDDYFTVSSIGAVLIVPVSVSCDGVTSQRYFAITFGYGRSLLHKEVYEERFGLKCVLNSVDENALRTIKFTDVSGSARQSSEQMPKMSSIDEFSLDIQRNLLSAATAKSKAGNLLEGTISGSDSLSVNQNVNIGSISSFLEELYKLYQSNRYQENFDWVDNIAAVKNPNLIKDLWGEAIDIITEKKRNSGSDLWMAVPDVLDWENVKGFWYEGERKDENDELPVHDDILMEEVLASFSKKLKSYDQLRSKKIVAIDSRTGKEHQHWSAAACLVGELQMEGKNYCVTSGKWYEIARDYVDQIEREYKEIQSSDNLFIPYLKDFDDEGSAITVRENDNDKKLSHEARYNYEAQKQMNESQEGESYLLMDRRMIPYGSGRNSKEELCDILSDSGERIHIKRCSGSSAMSHLFNQGLVSVSLEIDGDNFITIANKQIEDAARDYGVLPDSFLLSSRSEGGNNAISEVVFGIVKERKTEKANLPFFSKVALASVKRQLKRMHLTLKLNWISRQ